MFDGHYIEWTNRRVSAITDRFGKEFFLNKTILELGCGLSGIGDKFAAIGSVVYRCDGRKEHIYQLKDTDSIFSFICDLDMDFPSGLYDIILSLGTVYHLKDASAHIKKCCVAAKEVFIIETECLDTKDNICININEPGDYDQALGGVGSRPSPSFIENEVTKNGFIFDRYVGPDNNDSQHKYMWSMENNYRYGPNTRAMWFCKRKV